MKLALIALAALLLAGPAGASTYSITLSNPAPVYGDTVSFTEVLPKDAFVNSRNPQFPTNPQTQIGCTQNGTTVYATVTSTLKGSKTHNADGTYTIQTGDIPLYGRTALGGNQYDWPGGAADCSATVYTVHEVQGQIVFDTWATLQFTVGA